MSESLRTKPISVCKLCGSENQRLLYDNLQDRSNNTIAYKWSLVTCQNCGFIWLNPAPYPDDIATFYQGNYYTHRAEPIQVPKSSLFLRHFAHTYLGKRFISWLVRLNLLDILSFPSLWDSVWVKQNETGRILDVGCGNGDLIAVLQQLGWQVQGIEPDDAAASIAREVYGLPVQTGMIDDLDAAANSFDLIRMNHVIEHLIDPIETLSSCYRLLKSGGYLIISTPNVNSLIHQKFAQDKWWHLDPPRHLCLFSPNTLKIAVQQAGFTVNKVYTSSSGAKLTWLASKTIAEKGYLPLHWRRNVSSRIVWQARGIASLEALGSHFTDIGENLQIIAQKQ